MRFIAELLICFFFIVVIFSGRCIHYRLCAGSLEDTEKWKEEEMDRDKYCFHEAAFLCSLFSTSLLIIFVWWKGPQHLTTWCSSISQGSSWLGPPKLKGLTCFFYARWLEFHPIKLGPRHPTECLSHCPVAFSTESGGLVRAEG